MRGELEEDFLKLVMDYAKLRGWRRVHVPPVRLHRRGGSVHLTAMTGDRAGWPDLVMVRRGVMIAAELKVGRNTTTPEQDAWLADLGAVPGVTAVVWRPRDWDAIRSALD